MPFRMDPPSRPNHFSNAPPSNIILGVGFQHMNFEGHKHSLYINLQRLITKLIIALILCNVFSKYCVM
jgi:hypothetical protein